MSIKLINLKGLVDMNIKMKANAVIKYAQETYESYVDGQKINFKVTGVEAVGPNTFKMHFRCTDIASGFDRGFHEIVQYFDFVNDTAYANYQFRNMDAFYVE
jgi:hypothetical protein